MTIESIANYECEPTSVQELETSPYLERDYRKLFWAQHTYFSYLGRNVTLITRLDKCYPNNYFKSELEIDLSKVEYWTILDSPICAKIHFKDSIVPGMLMTITCDGNDATLVFFPMSLCCSWTDDYHFGYHFFKHDFKWRERPFTQIFSLFRKGKKIAFSYVRNQIAKYEPEYWADYIHVW